MGDTRSAAPAVGAPPVEVTPSEAPNDSSKSSDSSKDEDGSDKPAPASPSPSPASFRGARFLHVGDSFAGALGLKLGEKLRAEGAAVFLEALDSSYIVDWAHRKSLDRLVWKYNPDLVIVTLGANELAMENPEQRARAIRKIVEQIGDRPCVWVAIPYWSEAHNTLMEVVRENSAPCVFHDTNALYDVRSMARAKDGIHPTESARLEWASFFLEWLRSHGERDAGRGFRLRP